MPFDWAIFMRILMAVLKILVALPGDVDNRPIVQALSDATDKAVNGGTSS